MTRVTSKGQVTIPKEIRDKLGIGPGSEVGFHEEDGQIILRNEEHGIDTSRFPNETEGQRFARVLAEFGKQYRVKDAWSNKTTDEIMEELRGYSEDANDPGFQRRS